MTRISEQAGRTFTRMDLAQPYVALAGDSQRLDAHFAPIKASATAFARHAAVWPLAVNHHARIPTLTQKYVQKLATQRKATLNVANTDINGRFVDGSGQVPVGKPKANFAQLRAFGQVAGTHWDNAKTFLQGTAHLLNPGQTLPTVESRYATRAVEQVIAGLAQSLSTHPFDAARDDSLALRVMFDEASDLAGRGFWEESAQLRAQATLGLIVGVGMTKGRKVGPTSNHYSTEVNIVNEITSRKPNDVEKLAEGRLYDKDKNFFIYEYRAPPKTPDEGRRFLYSSFYNGELTNELLVHPMRKDIYGGGKQILDALMFRLWADGLKVQQVNQKWMMFASDNYDAFTHNVQKSGMSWNKAATHTWSGQYWANQWGFTDIVVDQWVRHPRNMAEELPYVKVTMKKNSGK